MGHPTEDELEQPGDGQDSQPSLNGDEMLGNALLDAFRAPTVAEQDSDDDSQDDADDSDTEDESAGEPAAASAKPQPPASGEGTGEEDDEQQDPELARWLDVVASKPQRISEAPGPMRGRILEGLLTRAQREMPAELPVDDEGPLYFTRDQARAAIAYAIEQARREAQAWSEAEAEFATVADLDADGEREWRRQNPQKRAAYDAWLDRREGGGSAAQNGNNAEGHPGERFVPVLEPVKAQLEEAGIWEQFRSEHQGRYPMTDAGMSQFTRDAMKALADHAAGRRAEQEAEEARAKRRQEAAERRKALPRVNRSEGAPIGGDDNPLAGRNNVSDLLAAGIEAERSS